MEKAALKMTKYDTTLGKMICMSRLVYVSRQFWSFIPSQIKRNNYERSNYNHIVKNSGISLQIGNMKLRFLNQYPNTNKIFAQLLLGSQKSVRKVSVFKIFLLTQISSYNDLKTLICPIIQNKITTLFQKFKVQVFYGHPLMHLEYIYISCHIY